MGPGRRGRSLIRRGLPLPLDPHRRSPRPGLWREALACAAGGATALAFAPIHQVYAAIFGPAVLFALWRGLGVWRAARVGLGYGLGLFGVGVSWVYVSLHTFGQAPVAFAALATVLLVAFMALYLALLGVGFAVLAPRPGLPRLLGVVPALWVLLEALRSHLFTGFPWLLVGYSQIDTPLGELAPWGGVYLVSWATIFTAGGLVALGEAVIRRHWRQGLGLVLAVGLVWGAGALASQVRWTTPHGAPQAVTLIQGNVDARQRWGAGGLQAILDHYLALSYRFGADSPLVVWPELAIPLLYEQLPRDYLVQLDRLTAGGERGLLLGIADGSWMTGAIYNAMVGVGNVSGRYYKRQLVPFGEYLPLRWAFGLFHQWVEIPMADFTPGPAVQDPIEVGDQPVGMAICYDAAYGHLLRRGIETARWLVTVSNDAWFGDSLAPAQHLQIARMRAKELERPMARATNTGISAFIDERGRVMDRTRQFVATGLTGTLQPRQGLTPLGRFGDGGVFALVVLTLGAGILAARRSHP
ncbi:MAG: apolipoprotein N-acyltransferase [Candidatus Competibacterales bacterium]